MISTPQKAMRKSYSLCGWAVFALAGASSLLWFAVDLLAELPATKESFLPIYEKYSLYLNEAIIAVAMFVGVFMLIGLPKRSPERIRPSFSFLFAIFSICIAVTSLGNFVSSLWTLPYDTFFGGEADAITTVLTGNDPLQLIICVGILAPLFEEFFFRKVLIDCLYPHGELTAILVSGLLFGLFHQNVEQYFYTFAIGLLLAYLYCRTGSYLSVFLIHMAFNLFSGVFPSLANEGYTAFTLQLAEIPAEEMLTTLPPLLLQYALPLLYTGFHLSAVTALTVVGILILILKRKKIHIKPSPEALSAWDIGSNAFINSGMLTVSHILMGATAFTIFL